MREHEHLSEKVQAYVTEKLSPSDKAAFELDLQQDLTLQKAVASERILQNLLMEHELIGLRQQIRSDLDLLDHKKTSRRRRITAIVAAILLGTLACWYFYQKDRKQLNRSNPEPALQESVTPQSKGALPAKDLPAKPSKETILASTSSIKVVEPNKEVRKESTAFPENELQKKAVEVPQIQNPVTKAAIKTFDKIRNEIPLPVPCPQLKPGIRLLSSASAKDHPSGKITVALPDPVMDARYSLQPTAGFVKENYFTNLQAGEYHLYMKIGEECLYPLGNAVIALSVCTEEYTKTYSPEFDAAWPVPVADGINATVTIRNKAGQIVFEGQSAASTALVWNGNVPGGSPAPAGVYKVWIAYENGENCLASVTLFR